MDSALNQDESKFAILILAIFFQVLSHIDGLLDKMIKIFRNFRSKSILFQDSEYLIACDTLDLRDSIVISENNTDLRRRATLFG